MNDDKKNIFDNFLDQYDKFSSKKRVNIETYYKPSKAKSLFGFIFCTIFMLILIRIFSFNVIFMFIFLGDLVCLVYFALNLFTKKGFLVKQKYYVPEDYLIQEDESNNEEKTNEIEDELYEKEKL